MVDFGDTYGKFIPMHHPRKAFTLVELLTVIAIIGILAAIMVPVVGNIKQKAALANCSSTLRQLHTISMAYVSDNQGYLPPSQDERLESSANQWPNILLKYTDYPSTNEFKKDLSCPAFEGGTAANNYWQLGYAYNETPIYYGNSASDVPTQAFKRSRQNTRIKDNGNGGFSGTRIKFMEMTDPQYRVMFAESDNRWHLAGTQKDITDILATDRHGNKMSNVIFFDGHVDQLSAEDVELSVTDLPEYIKKVRQPEGEG